MDISRTPRIKTTKKIVVIASGFVLALIVALLTWASPSSPIVERASIAIDSVRRGDFVREVRGSGNLVHEHTRWITAQASARVERVVVQSGQTVRANDILIELSNPDLLIQTMQAEQHVRQAQIDLLNLRTNLQSQRLVQEGLIASTRTLYIGAMQQARVADSLLKTRLMAPFEANVLKAQAEELTTRLRVEQQRLTLMSQAMPLQIAVQATQVEQLRSIAEHQQDRLQSLQVRAPEDGVLQDLTLQLGQWVPEGTTLAKIVQPGKLKGVLRISESQAKDVQIGQSAVIDTRNGIIRGHVSRKDPAAQAGTVTIDVTLIGAPPPSAVPDMNVDGTVQIETLTNVLYTGRPASGSNSGTVGLFKLSEGDGEAVRVKVVFGRSSVNKMEIVRGLHAGDKVILSDMSRFDNASRVRIR